MHIKSTKTIDNRVLSMSKPSTNMADNKAIKPTRHVTTKELYVCYRMIGDTRYRMRAIRLLRLYLPCPTLH